MKSVISLLIVTFSFSIAYAGQSRLPFSCITREEIKTHPSSTELGPALRQAAERINQLHPDLADSVGFGWCQNLLTTSILAIARGLHLETPEECLGISFLVSNKIEVPTKAVAAVATQDDLIDGQSGAVILNLRSDTLRLPICTKWFQSGGPQ